MSTRVLVPRIVDAVAPIPVLAAEAAVLGTRFLASHECNAHPNYKGKVISASEKDTVKTTLFGHSWPDSPHRTLRTPFVEEWLGKESETQDSNPDELVLDYSTIGGQSIPIPRFMSIPPNASIKENIESMAFLMGQSAGLVKEIMSAGEVVKELVSDAENIIAEWTA